MLAAITGSRTKNVQDLPCYNGDQHGQETLQLTCYLSATTTYSFHNDTYLVDLPLAPDDLLQADAKIHYMIYTRERRACQRIREALHSPRLKSVWTAALRRQNILQLFTDTTRSTKRHKIVSFEFSGISNKNCVRDDRTKASRKLKSCCHEDREDSASPFFCFQCCSSPVHWQIFQSQRTKKGSSSLCIKNATNIIHYMTYCTSRLSAGRPCGAAHFRRT